MYGHALTEVVWSLYAASNWSSHLVTASYPHHHDSCVRSHCVLLIHVSLLATLSTEYDGYCGGLLELDQEEVRINVCRF